MFFFSFSLSFLFCFILSCFRKAQTGEAYLSSSIYRSYLKINLIYRKKEEEEEEKKIGKLTSIESVGIIELKQQEFFHSKFTRISFIMHAKSVLNRFTFPTP